MQTPPPPTAEPVQEITVSTTQKPSINTEIPGVVLGDGEDVFCVCFFLCLFSDFH